MIASGDHMTRLLMAFWVAGRDDPVQAETGLGAGPLGLRTVSSWRARRFSGARRGAGRSATESALPAERPGARLRCAMAARAGPRRAGMARLAGICPDILITEDLLG